MEFKLRFIGVLLLITAISFSQESNNTEKLFETNVTTVVTKKETINLDHYKSIILIPGGVMFKKYFEKINYFDKIEPFDDFVKEIKKSETI